MKTWSKDATLKDIYGPAMEIKCRSKADEYFEALVQHNMKSGNSREKAEEIERSNLGYYSGYYDDETMVRVQKFFKCSHPFLGKAVPGKPVTAKEAMEAGEKLAQATKEKS
jgi:hypothetical protein